MKKFFLPIFIIFIGCAQQSMLTGGEKDTIAPQLVHKGDSLKNQINFVNREFELKFNENIQYLKSSNSILINPNIKDVNVSVNKNLLLTKWEENLDSNTTYSFIFNNSIADLTEKNTVFRLQHTFSTGNTIDSGSINGKIIVLPKKDYGEDLLVKLINNKNKNQIYYGFTNKNGEFNIENIKNGEYQINYFKDVNNDFKLDTLNDLQGFISGLISIDDSSELIEMVAFKPVGKTKVEKTLLNNAMKFEIEFNHSVDSCIIYDTINKEYYYSNDLKKTHQFFLKDSADKFLLIINSKSSSFCDTLRVSSSKNDTEKNISFLKKETNSLIVNSSFSLLFNQFLKNVDTSKIQLTKDSFDIPFQIDYQSNHLNILPLAGSGSYQLKLFPKSIKGVIDEKNDTSDIYFVLKNQQELSTLELKVKNIPHSNSILQIIQNNQVKKEFAFKGESIDTTFSNCQPGNYQLRIIDDRNKDNYWTTGNITNNRQPENIFDYDNEIILKKNWTASNTWDFKKY